MQETFVVATENSDKFETVKNLLTGLGLQPFHFLMLADYPTYKAPDEIGSLEERAERKALSFFQYVKQEPKLLPQVILGVDEGIRLGTSSIAETESKEITRQILEVGKLSPGDLVFIIRSYYFLLTESGDSLSCTTEIPFHYLKPSSPVSFSEKSYPLSYTLAALGRNQAIGTEESTFRQNYNLEHSPQLIPIIQSLQIKKPAF